LNSGIKAHNVVEVVNRIKVLPMLPAGIGQAVMSTSGAPLAERAGARVRHIDRTLVLRIALVSRTTALTPAARAFVECVQSYVDERRTSGTAAPPDR